MAAKTKVIIALDCNRLDEARGIVETTREQVGIYKVGSILFTACGPKAVEMVRAQGREVFLDLKYHDKSIDGIVAFYLIVNFTIRDVEKAMAEIYRVLKNGGLFLTSFHIGNEVIHLHEFLGKKVELDFIFHSPEEVVEIMERCCFVIDELIIRYPYRDAEYPSKRAYIFARKI